MTSRRNIGLAFLFVFLLLPVSCVKVRRTPYQLGLNAYYAALVSGTSEETLNKAITDLNEQLANSPADPGLLALRASGQLDLVRFRSQNIQNGSGIQNGQDSFDTTHADKVVQDLRLIQNLSDQIDSGLWIRARLFTMIGDLFLVRAETLPQESETRLSLLRSARQEALYRIAADFYQYAFTAAQVQVTGTAAADESVGLTRERDNARDGFANALSGWSKTRRELGFNDDSLRLTQQAIPLLALPSTPLPQPDAKRTTGTLYAYTHRVLQAHFESAETLTRGNYVDRVGFAEAALKEDLATRLLSNRWDMRDEAISTRLLTYYAALTARASELQASGGGNVSNELFSFKLLPAGRYENAKVQGAVEYVSVKVGDVVTRIDLNDLILPLTGMLIHIHSGSVPASGDPTTERHISLNRRTSLFAAGSQMQILDPAGRIIGTVAAQ